ncbi:MAG: hypothetical protein JXA92_01375 [candidate division Zixibacteria bacterium]|nr:hypothetical protein [candidate division Zixibacteria bacterium]
MYHKVITLFILILLSAGALSALAVEKPLTVSINLMETVKNVSPSMLSLASPTDMCAGMWHGTLGGYVENWFTGNEYYAVYQNPAEVGCTDTYPFRVTRIVWPIYTDAVITVELKPMIFGLAGTPECPRPGDVIYEGPLMSFENLPAGGQYVYIDIEDIVCVYEPYFIGFYYPGQEGNLNLYVDNGTSPPPRGCACYNDYGYGWRDLVVQENFEWNLCMYSEGYNSLENSCADSCALQFPGDVDGNDVITAADVTYLTDYLYYEGAAPVHLADGDANGDCLIDKGDAYAINDHVEDPGNPLVECTCVHPATYCCYGVTGNVDCSWEEEPDISDITRAIDFLYIMHYPLCCPEEADVDGSGGAPDISDITYLIDHLYLTHKALPPCP